MSQEQPEAEIARLKARVAELDVLLRCETAEKADARVAVSALEARIAQLEAGGCARDQDTTQFCAEAMDAKVLADRYRRSAAEWSSKAIERAAERDALRNQLEEARGLLLAAFEAGWEAGTVAIPLDLDSDDVFDKWLTSKGLQESPTPQTDGEKR